MPTAPFAVRFNGAEIIGEADGFGLPVVFLHAGVADRRMWRAQMEAVIAAGFHAVSFDRRGFGESQSEDVAFSHLEDLEEVLNQLSIHAAVFVGNADGGELALDFALENPERTVGLVLVGTSVSGEEEADLPEEVLPILDALDDAEERDDLETINKIYAHLWLDGPLSASGRVSGEVRELFLDMNGKVLEKPPLTREEAFEPAIDRIGSITAPTLLVVGELDFPAVIDRHDGLSEEMENAFAVVLEDTAHLPGLERPDLFNPLLLEFLQAISGIGEAEE